MRDAEFLADELGGLAHHARQLVQLGDGLLLRVGRFAARRQIADAEEVRLLRCFGQSRTQELLYQVVISLLR